ncbi:MAG: ATP-binding cassette domain-containing protein [Clostridium sp.]
MKILRIKNLTYQSNDKTILNNISFNVEKGDCISIIGESGSGKSTLLKIISDLTTQTKGGLIYNEKQYIEYDPIHLRREISYCIQIPTLFGETVYENVTFPFK